MKRIFNYQGLLGEGNPLTGYPQLLEAAINEFAKKKFDDASLNDILKNADMSKGSFYYNFGDKFGLYLAMMDLIIAKKKSFFVPFLMKHQNSGDFFETMKAVSKGTMEFMYMDERMYHLTNRFMEVDEELRNRLMTYFPGDYNQWFEMLAKSAIESGQIATKFSPQFIVKVIEIMFTNMHKLLSEKKNTEEMLMIVDRMFDLMQYGFSTKKEEE